MMNIGYKITKPIETQEQCNSYADVAKWCNGNGCHIEDKGEYYEVVENEEIEIPVSNEPTIEDRVATLEADNESMNDIVIGLVEVIDSLIA